LPCGNKPSPFSEDLPPKQRFAIQSYAHQIILVFAVTQILSSEFAATDFVREPMLAFHVSHQCVIVGKRLANPRQQIFRVVLFGFFRAVVGVECGCRHRCWQRRIG